MEYRMVGSHPFEVHVGDARLMCEPGEFVDLSDDDVKLDQNKQLIDLGILLNVEKNLESPKTKANEPAEEGTN